MYLDMAPLEGITGALFRQIHHEYFSGVDRYYAPFISPTAEHRFTPRDIQQVLPEHNQGITLIPQLLTKNAEDFIWAAERLLDLGYKTVNLNAGCPSGTVTAKGKGSGLLADIDALDRFLDQIFSRTNCNISVKTRLGMNTPETFCSILSVYRQYPIAELIIHPRVRTDLYRHPVRAEYFRYAYDLQYRPISYNGGIITPEDYTALVADYPQLTSVMIGQGLISDPFLAEKIKFQSKPIVSTLRKFHDDLLDGYTELFESRNNAARRMKELWFYLIQSFDHNQNLGKAIAKAKDYNEYLLAVNRVFGDCPLLENSAGGW